MRTGTVVALLVPLVVVWAAAWALPPHRNCHECGADHTARADRFDREAEAFATWHREEEEDVSHWTQAHQVTGKPARAWCATCPWEWEARPGQDLIDAVDAMCAHRDNPKTERTGR